MKADDGIPFAELDDFSLDRPSMQRLSQRFCEQWHVVLLGSVPASHKEPVTLGMPDPRDTRLVESVSRMLDRPVEGVRLNHYEIDKALDFAYQRPGLGACSEGVLVSMRAKEPEANASATELLDHVIRTAVALDASDIHIEEYLDDVDVRLRVDGVLRQQFTHITPANVRGVVGRIKVLAQLDITERSMPQDGRLRAILVDGDHRVPIDLRVSTAPGPTGEDVVMRVVEQTQGVMPLSGLGLDSRLQESLVELLENPEGMVLVTGPTGSGKTSTLYAGLDHIRGSHRKIVTVEDPVERFLPKVNQKQVGPKVNAATLARAFLRQDPDVILIGEIRDEETAQVAARAAITGHLVLSTLHTSDAVTAIPRLVGLGLSTVDVSDTLLGVVAQRLVRRLCRHCRLPAPPDEEATLRLRGLLGSLEPWTAGGCARCGQTGFAGRVGLFELLVVDGELASMIARGASTVDLRAHLRSRGHRGLVDAARACIAEGVTSPAEVLRVIPLRALSAMMG